MRPYLRVSDDKKGTSGSVEEQLDELKADADEQRWTLGDSYADDGISASKYGVKIRGDFARLVADLQSGTFGATILGVWETSRFSRQLEEWLPALKAMEATGVRVWASVDHRLYDPRIAVDRKALLTSAIDAEYESARTSSRVLRTVRKGAAKGQPHGAAKWGYRREHDKDTGKIARTVIVDSEAEVIRTLHRRLLAGDSMRQIARDFEGEGIRSRTGNVITPQVLREWAMSPVYVGLRVHQPKGNQRPAGLYPAQWPAIVDRPTWEATVSLLSNPARKTRPRDELGRHLLSFIARCAVCEGPMSTSQREGQGGWHYRCHQRSCLQINMPLLDRVVTEQLLAFLGQPELIAWADAQKTEDPELAHVRDELADVNRQLRELGEQLRHRRISPALAAAAEPGLLEDKARLEKRERELLVPPELLDIVERREQVAANWASSTMPAKRKVNRIFFQRQLMGELFVHKAAWSGKCPECREWKCEHKIAARIEWRKTALTGPLSAE